MAAPGARSMPTYGSARGNSARTEPFTSRLPISSRGPSTGWSAAARATKCCCCGCAILFAFAPSLSGASLRDFVAPELARHRDRGALLAVATRVRVALHERGRRDPRVEAVLVLPAREHQPRGAIVGRPQQL